MEISVIDVTPALAEEWLSANDHNRSINVRVVDAYARDMLSGNWALNGEAVKIAEDGTLLTDDGYAAQVERVFADPRTRDTIESFYREWWRVGWLTSFPDTPGFRTLAEGTGVHINRGYLYFAMTFALVVEIMNIRLRSSASAVELHEPPPVAK